MTGSIICGVDDSESARGAARVARSLAGELGTGLTFVRVVPPGTPQTSVSTIADRLERLSAGATDVDCGAAWRVEEGHPADAIVAAARESGASLVVVGSTGPRSSLLGSISADVSRRAPCPVVVVPPTAVGGDAGHDADFAGRIARFGLGGGGTEFAGGIARFGLGAGGR